MGLARLIAIVIAEAVGSADAHVAGGHIGEAGEDGLAHEVASGIGALLSVIAAKHQICLLGFRRRKKAHKNGKRSLELSRKESNSTSRGGGRG
jgi:hypothetical protein